MYPSGRRALCDARENASLGDIAIRWDVRWDESEIRGGRQSVRKNERESIRGPAQQNRMCNRVFPESHPPNPFCGTRMGRGRKGARRKEGERKRERDEGDRALSRVFARRCDSGRRAGRTSTRRELSFHSVTRLGSDGTKRNNSTLRPAHREG